MLGGRVLAREHAGKHRPRERTATRCDVGVGVIGVGNMTNVPGSFAGRGQRFNGALSFGYVKKTAGIDDESFTYLVELKVHVAMLELKDAPAAPGAVKMEEAR